MNLQVICGSTGGSRRYYNDFIEIDLEDVDWRSLLDDIGIEKVMEHFDLVPKREEYGVRNEDFGGDR